MKKILNVDKKGEIPAPDDYGVVRVREPNAERDILHTHKGFCEVFWIEQGQGIHVVNGRKEPLAAGDFVMVREGDVHTYQTCDEIGFIFVNMLFPMETVRFLKNRYFQKVPDFFNPAKKLPQTFKLSPFLIRWLEANITELAQPPRTQLKLESFLLPLFRELFFPAQHLKMQACPDWLQAACSKIKEPQNFRQGIKQFVDLAGRTQEHVAREAKKWLGKTPTDIVNQARLEYVASRLTEGSQEKMIEVAFDAGFENLSYFFRVFKRYFGTTPRQYRLRNQINIDVPVDLKSKVPQISRP